MGKNQKIHKNQKIALSNGLKNDGQRSTYFRLKKETSLTLVYINKKRINNKIDF